MTNTSTPRIPDIRRVLVLGSTGKTGRRVAEALRSRGVEPALASRRGPIEFDWSDRSTWTAALQDIDAVYLVDSQGPDAPAQTAGFAAAAKDAGVRRLVLLSARVWGEMPGRLATEEAVQASGLDWTILRPTWFAQNFTELDLFAALLQEGELRLPTGEGREAFVDLDDLAEVAAVALTEDGHTGRTYVLTGPRSLSFADAVAEIARAADRPDLRFTPVTDQAYRNRLTAAGFPAEAAQEVVDLFRHIREERGAEPADGVREALGRAPRDFTAYVERTDFSAVPKP
ncbi:NAD(P)H-binding protein [Streptomyces sp. NPDC057939]|uniref:NAD(P)H-binding protein n=1 Tax=Streptomyces sp. NPDC057939 TaxID=3346284 RepID=UPI0036EF10DF